MKTRIIASILLIFICASLLAGCEGLDIDAILNGQKPENSVIVTFDTDGGSKVDPITLAKGSKITEPEEPTKDGFVFLGWYLNDEKWDFDTDVVNEHIILDAKWEKAKLCVVHFFDEGLTTALSHQQVYTGSKLEKPEDPKKEEHYFAGWYTKDGKLWNFETDKVFESMNLEARYEKVTTPEGMARVDYDLSGMTEGYYEFVDLGSVLNPKEVNDEGYEGYEFAGWYIDGEPIPENYTVTKDVTLVAKWDLTVYNITYVLDGGTNNPANPDTFTIEDLPLDLKFPSHNDELYFDGWYSDAGLTRSVSKITQSGDCTVYATWTDRLWGPTQIIIQMTDNSNYEELRSGCRRYLAGNLSHSTDAPDLLDDMIKARNVAAGKETGVLATYKYCPDTYDYAWGDNISRIHQEVMTNAANAPDVYCNFVYDMVAASLKGSFANLLSTTMYEEGHPLSGSEHNYFAFEDDFTMVDNEMGDGYMIGYMRSLTLSKYKMYCLASDYYIDIVRSFMVVPVNVEMIERFAPTSEPGKFNSDRTDGDGNPGADGRYTVEDFYQLIWDGDWTYQTIMDFSQAIYSNEGGVTESEDIGDVLAFALSTSSSISSSGMLYSTPISIINREYDILKGDYTYSYPNTRTYDGGRTFMTIGAHSGLNQFCDSITALFKTDGVVAVSDTEASAVGVSGYGASLRAIRQQFAANRIIFGGVITLGSLESSEYREMNANGGKGYAIAPVPLYTNEYGPYYMTQIHSTAKVGAISRNTDKFAQCTKYLNYQSINSTEILNEYYDYKLLYGVVGAQVMGNVEMLKYIRANLRFSFDMIYEDVISVFYAPQDPAARGKLWHVLIQNGPDGDGTTGADGYLFAEADMVNAYVSYAEIKAKRLYDLEYLTFPALPN